MTSEIASSGGRLQGRRKLALVIGVVVVVAVIAGGAFGLWYILIGPPSPSAAVPAIPAGSSVPAPASLDGSWQINDSLGTANDTSSWVGYRVQEQFVGVGGHTAVGRSPKVTGSLTLAGSTVSAVSIAADLTALTSDSPQRDGELGGRGIETDTFPTATFTLTQPIALGSLPTDGSTLSATASGTLTLHGMTKSVQISVQAQRQGGIIAVAGSLPILFADYGIKGPDVGGFVTVNDHGTMEMHLLFTHA
jgi:polyisoprenoid-binding protein YceI